MQVNFKKDFGGSPKIADNLAAFQEAFDYLDAQGGGVLYVPGGRYEVSGPPYFRNNIELKGDGAHESVIVNMQPAGGGPKNFCILIGNFDPTTYEACVHFDVNDIGKGSSIAKLKDKANTKSFKIGDLILLDSADGFTNEKGKFKPYQALINRILALNETTGQILLEDAVTTDIFHARIGVTNKFTDPKLNPDKIYICKKPLVHDIGFESHGDWTMRFGIYKGWFENIWLKTTDIIPGNGLSYCTFKNIEAFFSQKVIEMALYSHNSIVDGLIATWYDGLADTDIKPLLKMGENQRDCEFKNMIINSGQGKYFGMAARFEHAFNNSIHDSVFNCPTVYQNGIEFTTNDPASIVTGNKVYNNKFNFGNIGSFIKFDVGGTSANVTNNSITDNTFSGTAKKNEILIINNTVINNIYQ